MATAADKALDQAILETSGQGLEEVTADDLQMPFIRPLQALSPQIKKSDAEFIEGAAQGDIFNTVTKQVWKGEEGVLVIPVYYQMKYLEFVPRSAGGGFVGELNPTDSQIAEAVRDENNIEMLKSGNELVRTAQHYVKIVHEDGLLESAIVDMKKTGLKRSRVWNSLMTMQKHKGKTMPSFANTYRLCTVEEGNDKGSWFTLSISQEGRVPSLDAFNESKEFHGAISSGAIKLAAPSQEALEQSTEDIPF